MKLSRIKLLMLIFLFAGSQIIMNAQPVKHNYVFKSGDDGYETFRIPAIVTAKSGRILAFSEGRVNNSSDNGNIDFVMKTSDDGGKTWSKLKVIWNDGEDACQNPAPVVDKNTGRIIMLMTRKLGTDKEPDIIDQKSTEAIRVFVMHTDDEGTNWSKPKEITKDVNPGNWTWYATGPCHGIQIENGKNKGRLVIPCDHIEAGTKKYFSHTIYSDNGGKTWQLGGTTPQDQVNECSVAELADGTLILNMRNYDRTQKARKNSFSADGGESWSDLKSVETLPEPICQASILFSPIDEKLYFLNPADEENRIKMTLKSSSDSGLSWKTASVLHSGPSAYSDLTLIDKNTLGCLFEAGEHSAYEGIVFTTFEIKN